MSRYLHPGEEAGELRLCGDADRQAIMHWLASRLGLDGIKLGASLATGGGCRFLCVEYLTPAMRPAGHLRDLARVCSLRIVEFFEACIGIGLQEAGEVLRCSRGRSALRSGL